MVEACIFCDYKFKDSGSRDREVMLHFFKYHPDQLLWLGASSLNAFAEDVMKSYLKDLCENCLCHKPKLN